MRLLNTTTLELKEFRGNTIPQYAILSHTWDETELTFQQIQTPDFRSLNGFAKVSNFCAQARQDDLEWAWIDSCCIDRTSSAELSEAINSMYKWYAGAAVCYVFMNDVPPATPFVDERKFESARWFTRGWCLQELLAPYELAFFASDWSELGSVLSLQPYITQASGVPRSILLKDKQLSECNVAQKLSWASRRQVTIVEDMAYCLLGLFDINMPPLYGEGQQAMIRLQEEILRRHADPSIFLWQATDSYAHTGLLCDSPAYFPLDGVLNQNGSRVPYEELERHPNHVFSADMIGRGLQIELETHPQHEQRYQAWMFYRYQSYLVCIILQEPAASPFHSERVKANCIHLVKEDDSPFFKRQLYLPVFYDLASPIIIGDSVTFKLFLHSEANASLELVQVVPDHGIKDLGNGVFQYIFPVLDCPTKIGVVVRVRQAHSEALVAILWNLFLSNHTWGCYVRRMDEQLTLQQLLKGRLTKMPGTQDLSDRAVFLLPSGSYLRAALKSIPSSCLAHVALYPDSNSTAEN